MSEFDPKTTALLESLAPAIETGPQAWATSSGGPRRAAGGRLTRRRALVLALAVAALAAATAAGGVHGLVTRYFPGEGHAGAPRHPPGVQAMLSQSDPRRRS